MYRATDTKLKRQVAIKILPPSLAADADRLARFQREAEVLASLNHPHIAAIYGLEESAGATALVMELVEGDDLSQRIARGAIPLDEALPIAKQIADALEAAHEQGIIHRDLKPANIKVRPDGTVKVLDFGLAKATEPAAGSSPSLSMSPTLSLHATQAGMILGTAAYMSPEQARGKIVDKRTDIWAFGAVLYEMLTGTRAFGDEDVSMTLSKILQREPDFDALPSTVPARVSQVLRVCLRKDPKQRVADIRDVRLALEGAFETVGPQTTTTIIGGGPRAALDGRVRGCRPREHRDGGAYAAVSTRNAGTRTGRDAPRHRHARHEPTLGLCPVARRPADCVRRGGRRGAALVGTVAGEDDRAVVGRYRGRDPSLLVARQPLDRLLRWKRTEATRSRRRRAADRRAGHFWSRCDVERGRRHSVCTDHDKPPDARAGHRGRGESGDDARPAAVGPPRAVLSARRGQVPVLRDGRAGRCRDLPGRAGRARPDTIDTRRRQRGVSARPPRARGIVARRRVAVVGADGDARGPAARCGEGRAHRRALDPGGRGGHRW